MIQVIAIIVYLLILVILQKAFHFNAYGAIHASMRRRNCTVLDIQYSRLLGSRHGWYTVKYIDPNNELFRARCHLGWNKELYWSDPELLRRYTVEQADNIISRKRGQGDIWVPTEKTEKERLVDELTSGYKFERLWAIKQIREMETVEEQLWNILYDLSLNDPEPDVRQTAIETINQLTNY